MAVLVLSQKGGDSLVYDTATGVLTMMIGPPQAQLVGQILVNEMNKSIVYRLAQQTNYTGGVLGIWLTFIALTVLAVGAFHETAAKGCGAKTVNRLLLGLIAAVAYPSFGISTAQQLLSCLTKGLSTVPIGSLAFCKDNAIEFRDPDGNILVTYPVASGTHINGASSLNSGIFALDAFTAAAHFAGQVWNTSLDIVGSGLADTDNQPPFNGIASSQTAFYIGRARFVNPGYESTFHEVSAAGALGPVTTLGVRVNVFGVSWGGTIYYTAFGSSGTVWQLGSGVFATGDSGFEAYGIVGLADGSVAILWHDGTLPVGSATGISQVSIYTSGGSLVRTIGPLAAPSFYASLITRGADVTSVWVWLGTQVTELRVADGQVLHSFPVYGSLGLILNSLFVVQSATNPRS